MPSRKSKPPKVELPPPSSSSSDSFDSTESSSSSSSDSRNEEPANTKCDDASGSTSMNIAQGFYDGPSTSTGSKGRKRKAVVFEMKLEDWCYAPKRRCSVCGGYLFPGDDWEFITKKRSSDNKGSIPKSSKKEEDEEPCEPSSTVSPGHEQTTVAPSDKEIYNSSSDSDSSD